MKNKDKKKWRLFYLKWSFEVLNVVIVKWVLIFLLFFLLIMIDVIR